MRMHALCMRTHTRSIHTHTAGLCTQTLCMCTHTHAQKILFFVLFSFSFVFSHMFSLHLISFVLRLSSCLSVLSCFSLFISLMLVRVFYLFIYIDMDMI